MSHRLRIAIADDEAEIRGYFARLLPRLGHEVVSVAENGQQLVEQCRSHRPDLVITDIKMPVMDGVVAANQIGDEHRVPVIFVSSLSTLHEDGHTSCPYAIDHLVKPIKRSDLEAAIVKAMRGAE